MLPLNTARLPAMYQNAMGLLKAGRLGDALNAFNALNRMAPERGEFDFRIGQIHLAARRPRAAAQAFHSAATKAPGEKAVWAAYADVLGALGDDEETAKARKLLKKAPFDTAQKKALLKQIEARPTRTRRSTGKVPPQTLHRLTRQLEAGNSKAVLPEVQALSNAHPKNEILLTILGVTLRAEGHPDKAEAALRKAISLAPNYGEAQAYLGELLRTRSRNSEALDHLLKAKALIARSPLVLGNLGHLYRDMQQYSASLECLNTLVADHPALVEGRIARALTFMALDDTGAALADVEYLLARGKDLEKLHVTHASILLKAGQSEAALDAIERALHRAPTSVAALSVKANILQASGAFGQASEALSAALDSGEEVGGIYRQIAIAHTFEPDDKAIPAMERALAKDDQSDYNRMELSFALFKAMEDTGQFEKAWGHLQTANQIMASAQPFKASHLAAENARILDGFADFAPQQTGTTGRPDQSPIFVTGQARSGTTLVEQILSSHSLVTGAGEAEVFTKPATDLLNQLSENGQTVENLDDKTLSNLGQAYLDEMHRRFPKAAHIADKSISTYRLIGLVWRALPHAKVIIVNRDPRDRFLSLYKSRFADGTHLYSYSPRGILAIIAQFRQFTSLWKKLAPDRVFEIYYEDLVANPEENIRKLLAFCGLDWEDACLNFHTNKRRVETLSLYQVRRPIYASSVQAWRRYETPLKEWFDQLDDAGANNSDG